MAQLLSLLLKISLLLSLTAVADPGIYIEQAGDNNNITVEQKDSTLHPDDKISWTSNNGNKSSIVITSIQHDGISLDITKPGDLPIQSGFSLTQRKDSVQVVWFIIEH